MVLNDYIRKFSRDLEFAIAEEKSNIERLNKEKDSTDNKTRTIKEEVGKHHRGIAEKSQLLKSISATIDELKRQLRELQKRFDEKNAKLFAAQAEISKAQESGSELQKNIIGNEKNVANIANKIKECENRVETYGGQLKSAKVRALNSYVNDVWKRILELMLSQEDRQKVLDSKRKLDSARNDNPEIANIFEALTAWKEIVKSKSHPLVIDKAKDELLTLEKKLNELFPGALDFEERKTDSGIIEEIYYGSINGTMYLYLPLDQTEMQCLTEGKTTQNTNTVINLIWGCIKAFSITKEDGKFILKDGFCILEMNTASFESINITLEKGCNTSFLLTPLPEEIWGALNA